MTFTEPGYRTPWHALDSESVLRKLDATEGGLSEAEARHRLEELGPNVLPQEPPPSWWSVFPRQFRSPLIYILAVAAAISLVMDEWTDAAFIFFVLILNGGIGGWQEWKAEKSALALQKMLKVKAKVERGGQVHQIDARKVVPGDIVQLESGDRIPADLRLLSTHGLEVDESLLTGESLPVTKKPRVVLDEIATVGDRVNMCFAGSAVVRGRARAVAVETGINTSLGRLAQAVMETGEMKPPLVMRMEHFTRVIALVVVFASISIGVLGIILRGYSASEMFFFAVALAVAAIPEGLPVAMSVALAVSTTRMARRGVIIRKLSAVEGLGSCTLVATDKTGTLTTNELTVREIRLADGKAFELTGHGFAPEGVLLHVGHPFKASDEPKLLRLARAAVLCNEADLYREDGNWAWSGDPVDVAFLAMGQKLGWNRETASQQFPEINRLPFEPERRFAASYHVIDGETLVLVKGAPERVLDFCGGAPSLRSQVLPRVEEMAVRGYRVLALAEGRLKTPISASEAPPLPEGLQLLGWVGMIDPLRPGVREAVSLCLQAGVKVSMVTGDHQVTALAIARDLKLAESQDEVLTGEDLTTIPKEELKTIVDRIRVFARVEPHQKLQLVEAASLAGHFVAVTGDGVNDAPALRAAHIGVAMGKAGTDVAREAAEIVIGDDDFASIVAGIEEGRIAYDNIRKVIYLLVSTGAAEIVFIGMAVATGMPVPLLPVQLLWLNLVTNGIQDVALAFEPGEKNVLRRAPRPPKERIFNPLMIERTVVAALVMGISAWATFGWLLSAGWAEASARNVVLLLMVLFENVHIGNCRSETQSALKLSPFRSPILLTGTVFAFLVHLAAMHFSPLQTILSTEPVGIRIWSSVLPIALTIFIAMEIQKWSWSYRAKWHPG